VFTAGHRTKTTCELRRGSELAAAHQQCGLLEFGRQRKKDLPCLPLRTAVVVRPVKGWCTLHGNTCAWRGRLSPNSSSATARRGHGEALRTIREACTSICRLSCELRTVSPICDSGGGASVTQSNTTRRRSRVGCSPRG